MARVEAYDPHRDMLQARYSCGTTSMMTWNGLHLDGSKIEKRRQVQEWRKRLADAGIPDADILESMPASPEAADLLDVVIASFLTGPPLKEVGLVRRGEKRAARPRA